jgi:hypothetical protein
MDKCIGCQYYWDNEICILNKEPKEGESRCELYMKDGEGKEAGVRRRIEEKGW